MDFGQMEKNIYGGNVEEDEELLAELMALQGEEQRKTQHRRPAPAARQTAPAKKAVPKGELDPAALAAALADEPGDEDLGEGLEDDEDLLNELCGLVRDDEPPEPAPVVPPPVPQRAASVASSGGGASVGGDSAMLANLAQLTDAYKKMQEKAQQAGEGAKVRRHQRALDKLAELTAKARRGGQVSPDELPPVPPGMQLQEGTVPTGVRPTAPAPVATPQVAQSSHHPTHNPVREAAAAPPTQAPPPLPQRKESQQVQSGDKLAEVKSILQRRRDANVANGKAAIAAKDKASAMKFVEAAKQFEEAMAAIDSASIDDIDVADIPPSPPPYRAVAAEKKPASFVEALEQRRNRFHELAAKCKQEGNDRKHRMNVRMAGQYDEAIREARAGRPVATPDLPTLPDMHPLPPQAGKPAAPAPAPAVAAPRAAPKGPAHGVKPAPAVGPLAHSGPPGQSRNQTQFEFLQQRQQEFKTAALAAKNRGDLEGAKKLLVQAKGFDKMLLGAQSGLPVNIASAPIPPQAMTNPATLQQRISTTQHSATGVDGRGEILTTMEKTLIEQVQLAENNRLKFTRLGDVGKVKLFESWAKTSKADLMLVRQVAKQALNIPKFHYETRQIPSADLFPSLAENVMELTIVAASNVPLPSGYDASHSNLFARFELPYPSEEKQSGKTKLVAGTNSPDWNETTLLEIGSRKSRGQKLLRVLKRAPLKIEIMQKGGFLRSDKLLGTAEVKLDTLETRAEHEESAPLKEGRRAVGGLVSVRVRIREPLADARMAVQQQKWLILDN